MLETLTVASIPTCKYYPLSRKPSLSDHLVSGSQTLAVGGPATPPLPADTRGWPESDCGLLARLGELSDWRDQQPAATEARPVFCTVSHRITL